MLQTITRRNFRPFGFFDDEFFPVVKHNSSPAVNIREDDKNYVLDFAIPGLEKKDMKIDINEDVLTVSSEVKKESEENKDGYKRKEFIYSSFSRSFYIPENVNREKIEAAYKDGVLTVSLPKQEEEKSKVAKTIEIS
jgi:HSP20 family protein